MVTVGPMTEGDGPTLPVGYLEQPVWVPPGPTAAEVLTGAAAGIGTVLAAPLLRNPLLHTLGLLHGRTSDQAGTADHSDTDEPPSPPGAGDPAPAPRHRRAASGPEAVGDPGWFGPDSVSWRVHADPSMFVAGVAAFALQSLHPLALAGVAEHGSFDQDFFGRTQRTGMFVAGVVYGSSAEAQARVDEVHQVHERVIGVAPDGRLYSANDPDLLAWVHVSEYLTIAATSRRFGLVPMDRADLDRYIAESAVVGQAMGIASPPRSWVELDRAFQAFRPQLAVGEQTRGAMRLLRDPPGLTPSGRRSWGLFWAGALACLPPTARTLFGLGEPRAGELVACRSLLRALGVALGPPPPLLAARKRLGLD
jgi:uncharacterized protein (DUF2236 family)